MNRQSFPVTRILGIPVRIDFSWFLIFVFVTWSLATSYLPSEYKGWSTAVYWVAAAVTAALFFASVLLHELAHSLAAQRFHIPVRQITLYIFGGLSELSEEPPTARAQFWITVVGPVSNLALGGLFWLAGLAAAAHPVIAGLSKYLAYINIILGLFNLVPGYPLDGGNVLMALVWGVTRKKKIGIVTAAVVGTLAAYLIILLGTVQLFSGNLLNGLWIAFIGWMMLNASGGAARQERFRELLAGRTVGEAMSKSYVFVYPETTLQSLADDHILGTGRRSFLVKKADHLVGMLTMHALKDVPKNDWASVTVEQIMIPLDRLKQVQPATELYDAIQQMDRDGVNQLPVIAGGEIQGVLTREDVINFIRRIQGDGKGARQTV